jgi:cytochrome c oxidase cbb3-type subunit 3
MRCTAQLERSLVKTYQEIVCRIGKNMLLRTSIERNLPVALLVTLATAWNLLPSQLIAQEAHKDRSANSIALGKAYFRVRCASCHGLDARGGSQGPNLASGGGLHSATDAAMYTTITEGVPGTAMPGNDFSDQQAWAIIAFIRSQSSAGQLVPGDIGRGRAIFTGKANCASCHMVSGEGGRLGPDLSHIGAARTIESLTDSIREPSKDLSEGPDQLGALLPNPSVYDTVTVTTREGQRIVGVAKNEDNFSIQLMDVNSEIHSYLTKDLQSVVHERKSLMPVYDESMLSKAELQDLLAYLHSLRGSKAIASRPSVVRSANSRIK